MGSSASVIPWKLLDVPPKRTRDFAGLDVLEGEHAKIVAPARGNHHSFLVCIQLQGRGTISHGDASTPIECGETFVAARVTRFVWCPSSHPSRCIVVCGGSAFSLRFQPRQKEALLLEPMHPVGLLLGDFAGQLKSYLLEPEERILQKLAEVCADLIDTAVEESNTSRSARSFAARLHKVERRLDDPDFDAGALSVECKLTLRSLQKRFQVLGTTPRKWILDRRLERIRKKLEDPSLANMTIRKIALTSGFRDFSYFIRTFKAAFKVSPGRYRRG